jgi:hypothetical protein
MKLNKLNIINTLNRACIINGSRTILLIETDDIHIVMPFWGNQARIIIDDRVFLIDMVDDTVNTELLTLGEWDLPRLNNLIETL